MCLAIPGKLMEIVSRDGLRTGRVDFGGIKRDVCLECLPDGQVGDYVLVHVGFAISVIDEEEAMRSLQLLRTSGELEKELQRSDA